MSSVKHGAEDRELTLPARRDSAGETIAGGVQRGVSKDRPFVLLGVNSDKDRAALKSASTEKGITWRSWFDGGSPYGPIASRWSVYGWPTIVVIDKAGVIRFKQLPHYTPIPLNDAVDSLLAEK